MRVIEEPEIVVSRTGKVSRLMDETAEKGKRLSYKFAIFPNKEQERYFAVNFGCVRFVYNHFLDARIKAYEATKETLYDGTPNPAYNPNAKPLSFYDTSRMLTTLKKETVDEEGRRWLYDADATALVYALRNLDKAYQNFFRRVKKGEKPGFPKFKSRHSKQSFTVAKCEIVDKHHIKLPKVGVVRAKVHSEVKGSIVSATISKTSSGAYFAAVNVKEADIKPLPEKDNAVGVTFGIKKWAVTSDGQVFENPQHAKRLADKLAREQIRLSRMDPNGSNYQKQKRKIAKIYERIADGRRIDTHKMTRELVNGNGTIISREMSTTEMMRSGGKAPNGKKLPKRALRKINRALLDANFFEINRQLAYKSDWAGRQFVLVPGDAPTAQVCAKCGYKHRILAKSLQQTWQCPSCLETHDRKYNGAENVLEAGLDILHEQEEAFVTKEVRQTRKKKAERLAK